jgi:hypothetical protein
MTSTIGLARSGLAIAFLAAAFVPGVAGAKGPEETLADKAAAAGKRASDGQASAKAGAEHVTPLAAERKGTNSALPAKQRDFDKHEKAGAAAKKKFEKLSAKESSQEASAAYQTAKSEYDQAGQIGDDIVKTTAALRATEEKMTTEVVAAETAAKDAKDAAAEVTASFTDLQKTAQANATDTKKAATAAKQGATKARTAAGLGTPESYAKKKEQNQKDDDKLGATLADAKKALDEVTEARKTKKKGKPAWMGDVAGAAQKAGH